MLSELNAAVDGLQAISEQLDPLETAYADVRFLDVDFVHAEKQYAETLATLRDEIDDERAFTASAQDVEAELRTAGQLLEDPSIEIAQVEKHITAARDTLDDLSKRDQDARRRRKVVVRHDEDVPRLQATYDSLSTRLSEQQAARQRLLDDAIAAARRKLDELSREPELALAALQSIDASVENLPSTVAEVAALRKDIELMRTQLQTKLSVSDRVKKQLADVSAVLEESVEAPAGGEASAKKKRKGRKNGQKEEPQASPLSRQEQLAHLHSTATRLKSDVLEKLLPLESELKQADVPFEQVSVVREKTEENLRRIQVRTLHFCVALRNAERIYPYTMCLFRKKSPRKKTSRRVPTLFSERLLH